MFLVLVCHVLRETLKICCMGAAEFGNVFLTKVWFSQNEQDFRFV